MLHISRLRVRYRNWSVLVVANGEVRAVQTLVRSGHPFPYGQRNQLYRNEGGRFAEIRHALPANEDVSRGTSMGDLDNDGDTDLVIFNNSNPPQVLLNTVGNRNHWIGLRLTGVTGRDMYGARVGVFRQNELPMWRRVRADASYLSANDPRVIAGLGGNDRSLNGITVAFRISQRREISDYLHEIGNVDIVVAVKISFGPSLEGFTT